MQKQIKQCPVDNLVNQAKQAFIRDGYGQQNSNMLNLVETTLEAMQELMIDGFTVLSVKLDGSKPVIQIMNIAQCAAFVSATTVSRPSECGRELKKVALVHDCQIEWTERGH